MNILTEPLPAFDLLLLHRVLVRYMSEYVRA